MDLRSVKSESDLAVFYEKNKLVDVDAKISFLRKSMKIRATRYDVPYTTEEELISLEELVLSHLWEGA